MATEYKVPTVDVLAVDGETKARHNFKDSVENLCGGDCVIELLVTSVGRVGGGKDGDDHGDGPVEVTTQHTYSYQAKDRTYKLTVGRR